jgi:predicted glutamine amidotransferase
MCGIVGYIGRHRAVPIILEGLKRLEYRGYDSAGIAVYCDDDQLAIRRAQGKLRNLEEAIRLSPVDGSYGIGHTRWATHGRPTEENAHPHRDCSGKIVVVHNGIVENYLSLKRRLKEEGHKYTLVNPQNQKILSPISVTTLIHHYCEEFDADKIIDKMMKSRNWKCSKYYGKTKQEIKDQWEKERDSSSSLGTAMHLAIENTLNNLPANNDSKEYGFFKDFWKDFKLKYPKYNVYRTEMLVFDEDFRKGEGLCGSIDCLLKNNKDQYIILDWKRSKECRRSSSILIIKLRRTF